MEGTRANVRSLLIKMLRREDELRLSDAVQRKYADSPDDYTSKEHVTLKVQHQVCREFGFTSDLKEGLDLLRSASALFPGDQELRDCAHWLKYNIVARCPLALGSHVPDIPLMCIDGSPTTLHQIIERSLTPTVLVVGSHT